jgi:hypothetical protein
MVQAMQNTPPEAVEQWTNIIAKLCVGRPGGAIMNTGGEGGTKVPTEQPAWAARGEDKRAALHWDTSQTVANVVVNGKATLAIVDTGSYKTILDIGMARILGLPVREAVNGDCGTYSVPGTGQSNCYAGVVDGTVELQLAPGVVYGIQGMKLIAHPQPLALIGGDVLSGGRPVGEVNFTGLKLGTDAQGHVRGSVCFEKGGKDIVEPLVNVPTARGSHSAGTRSIGMVQGPPLGGQCLRHDSV